MSFVKVVSFLFPFLREMILGDKTFKLALKENKIRVLLLVLITFCLGWTVYSLPRMIRIAAENVSLHQELKAAQTGDEPASPPKVADPKVEGKEATPKSEVKATSPPVLSNALPAGQLTTVLPKNDFHYPTAHDDWNARKSDWLSGLDQIKRGEDQSR